MGGLEGVGSSTIAVKRTPRRETTRVRAKRIGSAIPSRPARKSEAIEGLVFGVLGSATLHSIDPSALGFGFWVLGLGFGVLGSAALHSIPAPWVSGYQTW